MIRLTVMEEGSDGPKDTFTVVPGFMQLSKQWQPASPNASYHITMYETGWPVKVTRLIRVSEEDTKKCARITCNTYARERPKDGSSDFNSANQIRIELELLDPFYITVRSNDNWRQSFLLQFHHACLKLFISFLNILEADEIDHADDAATNPSKAELRQWNLKTIIKRSYEYQDLAEMGRKLICTTESLIDVVRSMSPVVDTPLHTNKFMAIDMELRGLCREAREQLQNFSDRLDHDLKYLELARNINQNRGVQQLTLLATIFLPLSLAAGVLSMQTRFKDLGTLLYDFFGVVVLLAAIVLIIMILLSLVAVVKELDNYNPQRPLIAENRPNIAIPSSYLENTIGVLRNRGAYTHKAWEACQLKLEELDDQEAEVNVFAVLDAAEDAYNEVILDLKDFSHLQSDAEEDPSVLLRPVADVLVIDTFCTELAKTREILSGNATSESGEPVERFTGIDKLLTQALPQLEKFFLEQNNTTVVFLMILEIIQLQRFVEEQGQGKWLQPLKDSLGDALYEQVLEAGAA
ncbi:hypothetical protein J7337_013618 [Fusarium musae]|uniref:Uncharacterized protein n=1 Tax=Fusarium musae TaxID=1042133 RepID=A0A9P8D4U3_9HYPO|nr:hypothetical protein J7337_013618 [Fusarium musae]KAG9495374.1 hypothetical protein J7337_013618 [Fusarium musae]